MLLNEILFLLIFYFTNKWLEMKKKINYLQDSMSV